MLKPMVREYFIDGDYNCAETMFLIVNKAYNLGFNEEDFKLLSAFGGGFGCEITCGALCGAIAVLGSMAVADRSRATEGFKELCGEFVEAFRNEFGHIDCGPIKALYRKDDETACLSVVELSAEILEKFVKEKGLVP